MTDISQKQGGWTPGPLRRGYTDKMYLEINGPGGSYITLLDRCQRPIAFVPGDYIPGEIDPVMEANANLFAAAPELYEALQAVLDTSGARGTYDALEYSKAVALAENALIKARANPSTDQGEG